MRAGAKFMPETESREQLRAMFAYCGAVDRMSALSGDLFGGKRLHLIRRVVEIEHHEVQDRRQRRVIEMHEVGHLEVEVFLVDIDSAEHSVQYRHRELLASLIVRGVASGVRCDGRRERRGAGSFGSVADRAVGLERGGARRIARGRRVRGKGGEHGGGQGKARGDGRSESAHFSATPRITDTEQ